MSPGPSALQALPRLEVVRSSAPDPVPQTGDTVTARITRLTARLALADILCVGPTPCTGRFSGVVRIQDVRATDIDSVRLPDSFRPGDLIRAEVLSLGDARSYFLSTAKNELGVVYARSVAGGIAGCGGGRDGGFGMENAEGFSVQTAGRRRREMQGPPIPPAA